MLAEGSLEQMAEAVVSTLVSAGVSDKKVFVGLSMGGYVLMRLLKSFPEQVRAAVFVSTRAAADSAEARSKRFKNIEVTQTEGVPVLIERLLPALLGPTTATQRPDVVAATREMALKNSAAGIVAALRAMAERPDSSDVLNRADFPMLFVAGKEDSVVPPAEMEALSKALKRDFVLINEAGHLLNLEQPTQFHDAISAFLKRRVL
jgi:pimeloyl-ACP methyl ester carboxylesterase